MSFDALFSPIKIRGVEFKNRILMPGMNTKMVKDKHSVSDDMVAYHAARAAGGCALNIMEVVAISPATHAYFYMGLYNEHHRDELRKVTDAIHANGGKAGVQLWHGGFVPEAFLDSTCKLQTPDNTTVEDIHDIVAAYGRSAKLAVEAGFDMVEYHAAHTYIPHEFLNPCLNNRTDEYGGCFENRCRFLLECIKSIRDNIPEDMPLFMRLDAIDEMMPKNLTEDEIVDFINLAADAGVDLVDLSRGNARSNATVYEVPPFNLEPGFNMDIIAAVKARVRIPVAGVGRINTPELANRLVEEGKLDMVAVGRAQLSDPEWCNKAKAGRDAEIRKCVGCTQGCYDAVINPNSTHITCLRNPMLCLEYRGLTKAETPKKVMIVGGGMAGLVTAEFLKMRGHNPIVFEASDTLGGQMLLAGVAPKKDEFTAAAKWEGEEARRMGIDIRMNTRVTPELIAAEKPDHVVIAIGSDYVAPAIPGLDGADVYTQYQVLRGEVSPTGNVVILGGGGVGTEVAQQLAVKGAQVTILDAKRVGNGMGMLRKMFMDLEFPDYGIKRVSFAKVTEVQDHKILYKLTDKKTKKVTDKEREFDALVICTGIASRGSDELQAKCTELGIPFNVIGDAKKARMALDATAEAYAVGATI